MHIKRWSPFHVPSPSWWPVLAAVNAFGLTFFLVVWFHSSSYKFMFDTWVLAVPLFSLLLLSYQWWRDVVREATFMGFHTKKVVKGLRVGMMLFIASEAMFFFSFFWAFFHSSLAPSVQIGCCWPPVGIEPLNPFSVPLLNTALLLGSGCSVTWCHHAVKEGELEEAIAGLAVTIFLGSCFTVVQLREYGETAFCISDGAYGSTFFVTTGFHGLHVIVGTIFLIVCYFRLLLEHFATDHHFGLEAAIWYWHFVDVIWILVYSSIYLWGSVGY